MRMLGCAIGSCTAMILEAFGLLHQLASRRQNLDDLDVGTSWRPSPIWLAICSANAYQSLPYKHVWAECYRTAPCVFGLAY